MNDFAGNGRSLRVGEMKDFLQGYLAERPFTEGERETFGVVWAVYYAYKLSSYVSKPSSVKDRWGQGWDFEGEIRRLPETIEEVRTLLQ